MLIERRNQGSKQLERSSIRTDTNELAEIREFGRSDGVNGWLMKNSQKTGQEQRLCRADDGVGLVAQQRHQSKSVQDQGSKKSIESHSKPFVTLLDQ